MSIVNIASVSDLLGFFGEIHEKPLEKINYDVCCYVNDNGTPSTFKDCHFLYFSETFLGRILAFSFPNFRTMIIPFECIKHMTVSGKLDKNGSKIKLVFNLEKVN